TVIWTPDAYPKKAEAARKRKGKRKGVSNKGKKGGKKQAETAVFE
ncbi:phage tail protein, partial [Neisseria meningitidis]